MKQFFAGLRGVQSVLSHDELVDLYLEIRPKLERVIGHRVGSLAVAAELAQEMFFRIDAIQATFPTTEDAENYFIRAAMNAAVDYLKIEARRRTLMQEAGVSDAVEYEPSTERRVLARDGLRHIEAALDELPEKCRTIFIMSRVQGLTHPQIAAELGVSQSLVEKYVVRALLHCRGRLGE